jgi:hypothetical protein
VKTTFGECLNGVAGSAVELITEGPMDRPEHGATLSAWFLRCPNQSPAWDCYMLTVIHLRPIPGSSPAEIERAGATHQMLLIALAPDKKPVPGDPDSWQFLHPVNLSYQAVFRSDADAVEALRTCAKEVVDGRLWAEPPLSHMIAPWDQFIEERNNAPRGQLQ